MVQDDTAAQVHTLAAAAAAAASLHSPAEPDSIQDAGADHASSESSTIVRTPSYPVELADGQCRRFGSGRDGHDDLDLGWIRGFRLGMRLCRLQIVD